MKTLVCLVTVGHVGKMESGVEMGTVLLGKIERDGKIVRLLRFERNVRFSKRECWFLLSEPHKRVNNSDLRWIPSDTRFSWVRVFRGEK